MIYAAVEPSPRTSGPSCVHGAGSEDPAVLMPLVRRTACSAAGPHQDVLVSNAGDEMSGDEHTDAVVDLVSRSSRRSVWRSIRRSATPSTWDEPGTAFLSLFTTFGTFSTRRASC